MKSGQNMVKNQNPDDPGFMVDSKRQVSIPQKIKSSINKELSSLGNFHTEIPLDRIFDILKKYGIIALQEDNTKWSGMLVGGAECGSEKTRDQAVNFPLAFDVNGEYLMARNYLNLSWCKMPSGRYEIVTYFS